MAKKKSSSKADSQNEYPVKIRNTKKRKGFVGCPVGNKRAYRLPGIGPIYGRSFKEGGYEFAFRIIKRFLKLKGNQQKFVFWLCQKTGATRYHSYQCYDSILKWCQANLN